MTDFIRPRGATRMYWISMMGYVSIIAATLDGERIRVDKPTLEKMAHDLVECGVASEAEDRALADDILATQPADDGLYDVTEYWGGYQYAMDMVIEEA